MILGSWNRWRSSYIGRLVDESMRSQGWRYGVAALAMIVVAASSAGTA